MGFVLVTVLLVAGSLNLTEVVLGQTNGYFAARGLTFLSWNWPAVAAAVRDLRRVECRGDQSASVRCR